MTIRNMLKRMLLYLFMLFFGWSLLIAGCIAYYLYSNRPAPTPDQLSVWNMCQMADVQKGGTNIQRQEPITEAFVNYSNQKISFAGEVLDVISLYETYAILISPGDEISKDSTMVYLVPADKDQVEKMKLLSKESIVLIDGALIENGICNIQYDNTIVRDRNERFSVFNIEVVANNIEIIDGGN